MPRAAICIGDGTWGGHLIEFNHTHDTVRETSDHGPFNAWGRDRGWSLSQSHGTYTSDRSLDVWEARVDAMEPVIVRNNFFNEKSGWGLDLDDGASSYEIYNNISIGGVSMKLREERIATYTIIFGIWPKPRRAFTLEIMTTTTNISTTSPSWIRATPNGPPAGPGGRKCFIQ